MKIFLWFKNHKTVTLIMSCALLAAIWILIREKSETDYYSEPIKRGTILESVYGIGTVTASTRFQFKLGASNSVTKLFVKEGDFVKKNDPIVNLGNMTFTAPFDATITSLPIKVGENVFPQSLIYTLVDLRDRYLIVSLDQRAALRVRQGQTAKISFDSLRQQTFEGTVEAVYSNENSFYVRISVQNLADQILPGMTGDVAIAVEEHSDALVIPVLTIRNSEVLVKQKSGRPVPVKITTGVVDGKMAEVIAGNLKVGDQLLLPK